MRIEYTNSRKSFGKIVRIILAVPVITITVFLLLEYF